MALAAAMFANHANIPAWQVFAVFMLIGIGLPALVGGRLSNW